MTAIVSVLMLGLGFLNGMIVTTILDKHELEKVYQRVKRILNDKFELEHQVDELKEELAKERSEKDQLISKLKSLIGQYTHLTAPEGPLERSNQYSDSESEDEDFPNPASPDAAQSNKD